MPSGVAPGLLVAVPTNPVPSRLMRPIALPVESVKIMVLPGPAVMPTGLDALALTVAAANSSMWPKVPTGGVGAAEGFPPPRTQKKRPQATTARTTMRDNAPHMGDRRAG